VVAVREAARATKKLLDAQAAARAAALSSTRGYSAAEEAAQLAAWRAAEEEAAAAARTKAELTKIVRRGCAALTPLPSLRNGGVSTHILLPALHRRPPRRSRRTRSGSRRGARRMVRRGLRAPAVYKRLRSGSFVGIQLLQGCCPRGC
jgi:hypothetical protein